MLAPTSGVLTNASAVESLHTVDFAAVVSVEFLTLT